MTPEHHRVFRIRSEGGDVLATILTPASAGGYMVAIRLAQAAALQMRLPGPVTLVPTSGPTLEPLTTTEVKA